MRLDTFLAKTRPELSRSTWQKYIRRGYVLVNGAVETDFVKVGDSDEVVVNRPTDMPPPLDLPVLYEDENVVVIDKPAGVLTHSKGALSDEFTVADFVRQRAPDSFPADNNRPGIVHRLDRATSGVLIAAKNQAARQFLQQQFAGRRAHKTYLAIVDKAPSEPAARIELPIGRNPKKPAEFRVDAAGKSATTDYRTLETFTDGSALVELRPLTGRTHQLRVHLAYIGAPIVGDPIYGAAGANPLGGMMLHAQALEITIPTAAENQRQVFMAEPPADFEQEIIKRRGQ